MKTKKNRALSIILASSLVLPNFNIVSAGKGTQYGLEEQNTKTNSSKILKIALPAVAIAGVGGAILCAISHSRIDEKGKAFIESLGHAMGSSKDKSEILYILDYLQNNDISFAHDCSSDLQRLRSEIERINPEDFEKEKGSYSKELLRIFTDHAAKHGIPLNSFPNQNAYSYLLERKCQQLAATRRQLNNELGELRSELRDQTAEMEIQESEIRRQQADIEGREGEIRRQQTEMARREGAIRRRITNVERREAELRRQITNVEQREAELRRQMDSIATQEREIALTRSNLAQHPRRYALSPLLDQMCANPASYQEFLRTGCVNGVSICMPHDEFIREFKAHFDRRELNMPAIQAHNMHVLPRDEEWQREFLNRFSQSTNPELAKDLYAELSWLAYFVLVTDRDVGDFNRSSILPASPRCALNQFIKFPVPHFGRLDIDGDSHYFDVLFDSYFYDEDNVLELKNIMSSVADFAELRGDLPREQRIQNIESLNGLKTRCDALLRQYEGLDPTMTTVIKGVKELILDKHINRIQDSLSAE